MLRFYAEYHEIIDNLISFERARAQIELTPALDSHKSNFPNG